MYIHETAIIDQNVHIGQNTKVWHFSHISKDAFIGNNCILGQNVYVGPSVKIGNNVKIQNNVSIYEGVTLEDGVFCGPSCVFTNVLNPRSNFEKKNQFKKTFVCRNATIGANSTIICGVKIGTSSLIGAGALVTKDILDYSLNYGVPTKFKGWITEYGEKINFDQNNQFICKKTNLKYILKDNVVIKHENT